jgi:glucokinase
MNRITPKLIAKAAEDGDEIACEIYEKAGFYLGVAASSICAAVGPRRIIIGGGVAHAGKLLLDPLERTMRERVHVMPVDQVEVVPALLGDNSGVIGSASWAATTLN